MENIWGYSPTSVETIFRTQQTQTGPIYQKTLPGARRDFLQSCAQVCASLVTGACQFYG